jgi:hypothetical protein
MADENADSQPADAAHAHHETTSADARAHLQLAAAGLHPRHMRDEARRRHQLQTGTRIGAGRLVVRVGGVGGLTICLCISHAGF